MTSLASEPKVEIVVISLAAAEARRRLMGAQLGAAGLPSFRFVDAVAANQLSEADVAELYDDALSATRVSGPLSRSEIACASSHLAAYRHVVDRGLDIAVILEDDAVLSHQFQEALARLVNLLDARRAQAVILSHVSRYSAWGARAVDRRRELCRPHEAYGCHAYLITNAGAASMLSAFPRVRTAADDWRYFMRMGILDVRAVVPYLVGTSPFAIESQIGGSRWSPDPPGALARWTRKYLWQKFLFQLVVKPALRLRKQDVTW